MCSVKSGCIVGRCIFKVLWSSIADAAVGCIYVAARSANVQFIVFIAPEAHSTVVFGISFLRMVTNFSL